MVINMIFETFLLAILSLIVLFILTKLMGYRQVTQLSMYDYIIGISIGSIASEMCVLEDWSDVARPLTAMITYAVFVILLSLISRKSLKARHLIEGNPLVLYQDDKILESSLSKAKLDVNEFLMQLRIAGYFDLTQLDQVFLEPNGRFSIFVKPQYRPSIVDDLTIPIPKEEPLFALMINGHLFEDKLVKTGQDKDWFDGQLKAKGYQTYEDVLLVLCDMNNNLTVYNNKE